ncbi:MAG: hypothetical protein AAF997_11740 [Myxococcota bacterium]
MIRRTIRLLWRGAVVGFMAYAFFFARLGERTPFQHVMRIAATSEAQELGHEVGVATERITKHIGDQVFEATKPVEDDDGDEEPNETEDRVAEAQERVADSLERLAEDTYAEPVVDAALDRHVR